MKHLYKFSLLLLALLLPATAIAYDFEVDGIYYNIINGNELSVTWGTSQYIYTGDVTIPATVIYGGTTYSVTSIGDHTFSGCSGLTSVTIPNSVTTIGGSAFQECISLTSITIPSSVTEIGGWAFMECSALTRVNITDIAAWCKIKFEESPNPLMYAHHLYLNGIEVTNLIVPNSVTSIGNYAFQGCSGLTSVSIPNSVTSIGKCAFSDCSGLTSIDVPNSVTSIGNSAFYNCTGLNSVSIGNSVTSIGDKAFEGCCGLTSVTIGNSVKSIGEWAFYDCSGLTSVTIPNSVIAIGSYAFSGCTGLTSIDIPNSVTSIGSGAFDGTAWYNYQPDGLVYAGLVAYKYKGTMPNGTSIIIRDGTLGIAGSAFWGCSNLTSVTIPNSVTLIGSSAFRGCSSLTSITIPNSIKTIGNSAFSGCSSITEICSMSLTPPTIYSYTFKGCYDATLYVPDIALEAYKAADYWKDFINVVGMPYTFEVDGTSYHATTMNTASVMANSDEGILYSGNMVIPDSVTYAGMTFAVTGIENNAFDGCYELTSITIPNLVETIGEQAFQGCTGLTSLTIGSGVTAIGAKAFNYCNALETVKCLGTVPPVMASTDCFSTAAYNRATLLVPRQQIEAYQAADYWYKFAHIDGWGSAGRGDIDGDGIVSINDVTRMIDVILTGEHEGVYFESADLNSNGRLDIGDVTTIIDMLLNGN